MRLFALLRPDLSMGKINELLALRTLACMIAPQYKAIVVTRHHYQQSMIRLKFCCAVTKKKPAERAQRAEGM